MMTIFKYWQFHASASYELRNEKLKRIKNRGGCGDGSVGKVLVEDSWEPRFRSRAPT